MNIQQFANNRTKTNSDTLKERVLEIARELLRIFEEDIESGIEDGTYNEKENKDNRSFIAEAHEKFDAFEKDQPAVYVYSEGGKVQGASANCEMDFEIFDADDYEAEENEELNDQQTPEEWDLMITGLTAAKEIKPIY